MCMRKFALASTALITAFVIVGCGQNIHSGSMPGMDHGMSTASPSSGARADVNAADEMFVAMMIPHHRQAIEMADLILGKAGIDERVVRLARQIIDGQRAEVAKMQEMLDSL